MKDFAKQIKNKITRKYRRKPPKKTYLDYSIERGDGEGEERDTGESLVFNNVHTRISNMAQRFIIEYIILECIVYCGWFGSRLLALEDEGAVAVEEDTNLPTEQISPEQR